MKLIPIILLFCVALSPRQQGDRNKPMLVGPNTNRVQVVTSSVLRNGTNYQTTASMLETQAAKIVTVMATPLSAPSIASVQIGFEATVPVLVLTNFTDPGTEQQMRGLFIIRRATDATQEFYRTPSIGGSQSVRLTWDASPSPEVIGYNVYAGTASRTYGHRKGFTDSTVLQYTANNLQPDSTNYFAVTAFGVDDVESEFSNEVQYVVPPGVSTATIQIN